MIGEVSNVPAFIAAIESALKQEIESCAKVADKQVGIHESADSACKVIAAHIRQRKGAR